MRAPRVFVFSVLALGLLAGRAAAHSRSISYSTWRIRGRAAHVTARLAPLDVSRFPWAATAGRNLDRLLGSYLTAHLRLSAGDVPCTVARDPHPLQSAGGYVAIEWDLACRQEGALRLSSTMLLDVAPSHLHLARVIRAGAPPEERVFSSQNRMWPLPSWTAAAARPTVDASLSNCIRLGIEHIFSGYDHLVFLLALLLLGTSFGEGAKIVTGFTVAHSLTLGLAALGYLRPDSAPIDALIGLSVVLVAAENVWLTCERGRVIPWVIAAVLALLAAAARAGYGNVPALTLTGLALFTSCYFGLLAEAVSVASWRWTIAFLFGLVHGFGFAAVLAESHLPVDRLPAALLGFNAGLEIGQLAVVAAIWPLIRLAVRDGNGVIRTAVLEVGSAAALALGVLWFVARSYG